jgi:ATP/maltotriose-dependent transcriptional regulator MalT/DNA-binding SARP family transcriptional activator
MALPDRPLLIDRAVDSAETGSISFARSTGTRGRLGTRAPVPVGPGRAASTPTVSFPIGDEVVHEFPLQLAKVQRPPLRRETLRRERLLDWLKVKIHHRVVLVIAEAGYGKTTLLADFARYHRRPTMWYRLDEEDRNWVSFLQYLVAAGREIEPEFATATKGLLTELAVSTGPSRDTIISTFLRELQALGPRGVTLIVDDYHLVDDVPDVRVVVRELLNRAPERLTLVLASRQQPTLPLARLRTLGEVADLGADDLRFDLDETERLFRDTYKRPLEPDVLTDLAGRTEGWAASLEMVNTAIRGRSPGEIRAFVHGMTGAHGELYDYLAEEVVGDLDDEMQHFLMTTALLQAVDPTLVELVGGFTASRARELIAASERLGLLSTRGSGRRGARRYHPLVREFLESRLRRTLGDDVARDLHRVVARHAGPADWRLAAYHLAAADDTADLGLVVQAAVPTIMGSGDFALAESYVQRTAPENNAAFELFVSRMELHRGNLDRVLTHAEAAVDIALAGNKPELVDHTLSNLASALYMLGELEDAREVAETLARRTESPVLTQIAHAVAALLDGSVDGNLDEIRSFFVSMAREQEKRGLRHYVGVTWLDVADLDRARGNGPDALEAAARAIDALSASSAGFEVESARTGRAWALAHENRWDDAEREIALAESTPFDAVRTEVLVDIATIHASYGDRETAEVFVRRALESPRLTAVVLDLLHLTQSELAIRSGELDRARGLVDALPVDSPHPYFAFKARVMLVRARIALASQSQSCEKDVAAVVHFAARQGAWLYLLPARVLQGAFEGGPALALAVSSVASQDPSAMSLVAESVASRLGALDERALRLVADEAERRPDRWREAVRANLEHADIASQYAAAAILDTIGDSDDVRRLRLIARRMKGIVGAQSLGRGLARRLAPRVFVEDQGRVQLRIGSRLLAGSDVRRKVLALICFLLSRRDLAATRDHVLDALWPDLGPDAAVNSLNQTIYFLRRVLEPAFNEDLTPGYVHYDSDLVWLDPELVTSRSVKTRAGIRAAQADPSPVNVEELAGQYHGLFALDFAYEEWAVDYRNSIHTAYLQIMERSVIADTNAGAFDRAIGLARRALEVDPDAEQIELALLKLYRRTGAHAAAAEQYVHYSAVLRNDLGIEPPSLESL